ncbi:TetR family transcriptional regulator [Actinomyces sp. B33]|uniref:TetR/AcrR family transcriptional regulator n=1 Tax=Actinomyces sp. B33 TaxID=2942131 RepID=UPI0023414B8D|nr:TetR family transcriptional regulator [Actinomyces sp. B33]MDC4233694.1 TetR family transcriptional regulator [Actinomyces sp. B33]
MTTETADSIASTRRGEERRRQIVEAAAAIVSEEGPGAVTHRSVAARAGCSLSATTYYFSGLEDLLGRAGELNISRWASRAERVAETVETLSGPISTDAAIGHLLNATLPRDVSLSGHYAGLIHAGSSVPISRAYRTGRSRLNSAVGRVLAHLGIGVPPELVISIVDGAAVSALSEGRDVRETASALLHQLAEKLAGTRR